MRGLCLPTLPSKPTLGSQHPVSNPEPAQAKSTRTPNPSAPNPPDAIYNDFAGSSPPRKVIKCPLCMSQVYQYFLNGKQAIVMCCNTKCLYPFNFPNVTLLSKNIVPLPPLGRVNTALANRDLH
ncbi:hypothetical protein BDZ91DRAFT_710706 [Kalaharituber pfeilii]|nr:hypothetical protein BDZ91DRAFT_710706 [Kalaharituber pfeilii]